MFNRNNRKIFKLVLVAIVTTIFSNLTYADLNFGIVNAIKKQAKPLTDKKIEGTINHVKVGPNTVVLSSPTMQQFIKQDGTKFYFNGNASEIGNLKIGAIIIGTTGNGFLRKVTGVTTVNGQYVIETTSATLEEAIEFANVVIKRALTPADIDPSKSPVLKKGISIRKVSVSGEFNIDLFDVLLLDEDGNPATTGDQITASGSISFKTTLECNMKIEWFKLKKFEFIKTDQETVNIELKSGIEKSIKKEFEVGKIYLTPIPIGPIILVPEITVVVGGEAQIGLVITTGITQQATLTAGVRYENEVWTPIGSYTNEFQYSLPTISAGGEIKCYAGPKLALKFYDAVGPYLNVNGFLKFNVQAVPPNLIWSLTGGIECVGGVEMDIFDVIKLGWKGTFPPYSKVIVAGGTPPVLVDNGVNPASGVAGTTFTYNLNYKDADNNAPKSGYPKVHIKKGGSEITGSPFTMNYTAGNYISGINCTYSTTLTEL